MLGLLPLIAFLAFYIFIGNYYVNWGWRKSFLRSLLLWGTFVVLITEILSVFRGINRAVLTVIWLIPICWIIGWVIMRRRRGIAVRLLMPSIPSGALERLLLFLLVAILLLTALVAWVAPPNTWDSLNYHMARVAHWAQQQSVAHYATGIKVQNLMPPGAEFAALHFYTLASGDRLVNFVEWFAMLGSLVGVSLIARHLNAGKTGQLIAMALTAALPMGIAQATSTMTDYVVAFFLVSVAVEVLSLYNRERDPYTYVFLGLSVGLAILVKPTSFAYLFPFAILMAIILFRDFNLKQVLKQSFLVIAIIFILNFGYMARNVITFGTPIGDPGHITFHSNEIKNLRSLISNTVRNAGLHAGTPWESVNSFVLKGIIKTHLIVDLPMSDPRTTSIGEFALWEPRHEETFAGNNLHAYVFLISIILMLLGFRNIQSRVYVYAVVVISTFLLFSFLFKWSIFNCRLHLPFFVLYCPVAAVVIEKVFPKRLSYVLSVIVMILAWPWLLSLSNRPLIGNVRDLQSRSILRGPREAWYFGGDVPLYKLHKKMTDRIIDADCSDVAVMISGNGAEFPIWVYLGAPKQDLAIKWIIVSAPSEKYMDLSFQPCAAICQYCPDEWETFRGFPLVFEDRAYRLYLDTATPAE